MNVEFCPMLFCTYGDGHIIFILRIVNTVHYKTCESPKGKDHSQHLDAH